jgi:hypothetical protein
MYNIFTSFNITITLIFMLYRLLLNIDIVTLHSFIIHHFLNIMCHSLLSILMHHLAINSHNIPPSSQIYNVAIDGARILRSPELCEKLFKELIERGIPVIQPVPWYFCVVCAAETTSEDAFFSLYLLSSSFFSPFHQSLSPLSSLLSPSSSLHSSSPSPVHLAPPTPHPSFFSPSSR